MKYDEYNPHFSSPRQDKRETKHTGIEHLSRKKATTTTKIEQKHDKSLSVCSLSKCDGGFNVADCVCVLV